MTPDDLDLDVLAAVAAKATPGPWWVKPHGARRDCSTIRTRDDRYLAFYADPVDAEHMVAFSPDVAIALIERCRKAEAERDEREQLRDRWASACLKAEAERDELAAKVARVESLLSSSWECNEGDPPCDVVAAADLRAALGGAS